MRTATPLPCWRSSRQTSRPLLPGSMTSSTVSVKIPGSDIELARKGGAEITRLDFIGEVKDSKGVLQGTVRDDIAVKLKGETAGQLATRNLEYDTGFTLQPGAYTLKFLARENETGKTVSYTHL